MSQGLKRFTHVAVMVALMIGAERAGAQEEKLLPGGYGTGHLTAAIADEKVTIKWPEQPGKWQLLQKMPGLTAEWVPIPTDHYTTNAGTVSATLDLPLRTTLFCVKRSVVFPKHSMSTLPPIPNRSTNQPPRPRPTPQNNDGR